MIVAFSVGLAGVLVALGLAVVTGTPWLARIGARFPAGTVSWLPMGSAVVVTGLGVVMLVNGLATVATW